MFSKCPSLRIVGRERGRLLDMRPYNKNQYTAKGTTDVLRSNSMASSTHILCMEDYGNTTAYGHFHSRYRVWRTADPYRAAMQAPRLRWAYIAPRLGTSPDTKTFQWEMGHHVGLLVQSATTATSEEIVSVLRSHTRVGAKVEDAELRRAIEVRVVALCSNNVVGVHPGLRGEMEAHRLEFPSKQADIDPGVARMAPRASEKAKAMLERRIFLLKKARGQLTA